MTFRMALKFIRRNAPETEQTFRAICRNRYCRPVRDWAIFDLSRSKKLPYESVKRRYNRHLMRLHAVFGVSQVGLIMEGSCDSGEVPEQDHPPDNSTRKEHENETDEI